MYTANIAAAHTTQQTAPTQNEAHMAKQLSVEQRIQRANVQLMKSDQFCSLSGILMCGTNTVHDDPTMRAKTNGWNTKYGREFMSELDE